MPVTAAFEAEARQVDGSGRAACELRSDGSRDFRWGLVAERVPIRSVVVDERYAAR